MACRGVRRGGCGLRSRFSILNYATLTGHLLFWLRLEAALCIMVHIFYNLIWVVSYRPPYAIMQMDAIPIRLATAKGGMVTLTCNGMASEDD
jgi:hypothetical protein